MGVHTRRRRSRMLRRALPWNLPPKLRVRERGGLGNSLLLRLLLLLQRSSGTHFRLDLFESECALHQTTVRSVCSLAGGNSIMARRTERGELEGLRLRWCMRRLSLLRSSGGPIHTPKDRKGRLVIPDRLQRMDGTGYTVSIRRVRPRRLEASYKVRMIERVD